VIGRSRHLHDDRLYVCYVAERNGEFMDPPMAEHLQECAHCNARYDGIARLMDDLRSDADAELEVLFPTERLEAQRAHLRRRLDHLGQAAKVISFPGRAAEPTPDHADRARTTRWVAAAAAAGLFVGLAVGVLSNFGEPVAPLEVAVSQPVNAEPVTFRLPVDEETFLQELERAHDRQRARALMSLDAFTPSIRDINADLR